jgi:hypothetical protein
MQTDRTISMLARVCYLLKALSRVPNMGSEIKAGLLRHFGVTEHGVNVSLLLKWWQHDGCPARWEVRRIVPAVGYLSHPKSDALHKFIKVQLPLWNSFWASIGLNVSLVFGRSSHGDSHRLHGDRDDGDNEREYWFTTTSLLATLSFWLEHRRGAENKDLVATVFSLLLERACTRDFLLSLDVTSVSQDCLNLCAEHPDLNGQCSCLQDVLLSHQASQDNLHRTLASFMGILSRHGECATCMKHLGKLVSSIASNIEERFDVWADLNLKEAHDISLAGGAGKKRKRLDSHAVSQVVDALSDPHGKPLGSLPTISAAALNRAAVKHCCVLQASSHLTFKHGGTVTSMFDGVRLGSPAYELLLHVLWHHDKFRSTVLPPAVLIGIIMGVYSWDDI